MGLLVGAWVLARCGSTDGWFWLHWWVVAQCGSSGGWVVAQCGSSGGWVVAQCGSSVSERGGLWHSVGRGWSTEQWG